MEEVFRRELKVSKVEKKKFRFCSIDLEKKDGCIEISMEDYAGAINETEVQISAIGLIN